MRINFDAHDPAARKDRLGGIDLSSAKLLWRHTLLELTGQQFGNPTIQPDASAFSSFQGTAVISGGSINQSSASDLAKLINYGALPVQLVKLTTEDVSPTLGRDQLHSGVAAGIMAIRDSVG